MRAHQPTSDHAWSLDAKRAAEQAARRTARRSPPPAEQPAAPPRVVKIIGAPCNELIGDHYLCPRYWRAIPVQVGGDRTLQAAECACWCHREKDLAQQ